MKFLTRPGLRSLVGALAASVLLSGGLASAATATVRSTVVAPTAVAPAKDASLKSLSITSPKKIKLAPKFTGTKVKYTAVVPVGTKKVKFKAVPKQKAAKAVVKAPKKLKPGANKFTITVTAPDKKTKKVYTVTVTVLKKPTVTLDPAGATLVPGGFQVRLTLKNATITPAVTITGTAPACAASIPYAFVSAPDANNSVLVLVQGVVKGCAAKLALSVKPSKGYAKVAVAPVTATPERDKVAFNQKPLVRTADGFTVEYAVLHGTVACVSGSLDNPAGLVITNTQTKLTVSGLDVNTSATVTCSFTADADADPLAPVAIAGTSLAPSFFVVGPPQSQDQAFTVAISASGCVPTAEISDGPDTARTAITGPVKGAYSLRVSGLDVGGTATATVYCTGIPGSFADAEPQEVPGTAVAATGIGLLTAPRIADASDAVDGMSESDLPGVTLGRQPSVLYGTTPEWGSAGVTNVFRWQVSLTEYDDDRNPCNSPNYGINDPERDQRWVTLTNGAGIDTKDFPQVLNVGDLLAQRTQYLGRCTRISIRGTVGVRTATVYSTGVALASAYAPTVCSEAPKVTVATELDYAERGDTLTTTAGLCERALGLAVTYKWQVSSATEPTEADWTTIAGTSPSVVVVTSMAGRWVRSVVKYDADIDSDDLSRERTFTSDVFAIAGQNQPINQTVPVVEGGGFGLSQARMSLTSLGEWQNAAGSTLSILWQYSVDGIDWIDQPIYDANDDVVTASRTFTALGAGSYRAVVTFSSQTSAFESVSAVSNELTWAPNEG